MKVKRRTIHADAKRAKDKGKKLVAPTSYLHLEKSHKDWYNRRELGKQRGKPRYAPPKEKKLGKIWKNK